MAVVWDWPRVDKPLCSFAAMDIQLKGRVKVAIPVPVTATVAELSAIIRSELGDARAFKLIHRGKTLKVPGATLVSLGVKNRSKIMVMACMWLPILNNLVTLGPYTTYASLVMGACSPAKHAVKEEEVAVPCQGPGCGLWGYVAEAASARPYTRG